MVLRGFGNMVSGFFGLRFGLRFWAWGLGLGFRAQILGLGFGLGISGSDFGLRNNKDLRGKVFGLAC